MDIRDTYKELKLARAYEWQYKIKHIRDTYKELKLLAALERTDRAVFILEIPIRN